MPEARPPSVPLDVRYARSGDVSIAYRVIGEGERDLLFVHGAAGNLELEAESPYSIKFNERMSRFARLTKFDRRGTGLSDRVRETPSLETRMDDVRAVLDAVGSERAALFGTFEERGQHELKGVPGTWRLYSVVP